MAADQLETATRVEPRLADAYVKAAALLVPESENYLLDAGRALRIAGDYASAQSVLARASDIAPGRKDIKSELADVTGRIDPTDWLAEGPPQAAPAAEVIEPEPEPEAISARRMTRREELQLRNNAAWREQDQTEPGSAEYWALGREMARIAVEIAALPGEG